MTRLELFRAAQDRAELVYRANSYLFPLDSVIRQLRFLIRVEEGLENDRMAIETMDLGTIAARDIEPVDKELADLLHSVSAETRKMLGTER